MCHHYSLVIVCTLWSYALWYSALPSTVSVAEACYCLAQQHIQSPVTAGIGRFSDMLTKLNDCCAQGAAKPRATRVQACGMLRAGLSPSRCTCPMVVEFDCTRASLVQAIRQPLQQPLPKSAFQHNKAGLPRPSIVQLCSTHRRAAAERTPQVCPSFFASFSMRRSERRLPVGLCPHASDAPFMAQCASFLLLIPVGQHSRCTIITHLRREHVGPYQGTGVGVYCRGG